MKNAHQSPVDRKPIFRHLLTTLYSRTHKSKHAKKLEVCTAKNARKSRNKSSRACLKSLTRKHVFTYNSYVNVNN